MNFSTHTLLTSGVVFSAALGTLHADSFDFSYTFTNEAFGAPVRVFGTFDGTAEGNLIANLTDAQVFVSASPQALLGSIPPGTAFIGGSVLKLGPFSDENNPVISFDGTQNDFYIGPAEFEVVDGQTVLEPTFDTFLSSDGSISVGGVEFGVFGETDNSPNSTWSVTDETTAGNDLPDSTSTFGLMVAGLVAIAAARFGRRSGC